MAGDQGHDRRRRQPGGLHPGRDVHPGEIGHPPVEQRERVGLQGPVGARDLGERGLAAGRGVRVESHAGQHLAQHLPDVGVVVGHQNPAACQRRRRAVHHGRIRRDAHPRASCSSLMPMPVSRTVKRGIACDSPRSCTRALTSTSPASVNLIALPT
jgi:hypothetical protein